MDTNATSFDTKYKGALLVQWTFADGNFHVNVFYAGVSLGCFKSVAAAKAAVTRYLKRQLADDPHVESESSTPFGHSVE